MNTHIILKIAKFLVYAAIFSVVFVLPSTFFPFIGIKYYFFRVTVELALIFVFVYWGFFDKANHIWTRLKKVAASPIFIAVSLFVLVSLLASIFAVDSSSAFWSNFERGEGTFQLLHYYIFFILLLVLLKEREDWKWAMRLSLAAAALLILYGVFAQLGCASFNLESSCWISRLISPYRTEFPPTTWGKLTSARFQGSLGNPSYVAPYLLFSLFYVLYLWFNRNLKPKAFVSAGSILLSLSLISAYLFTTITTMPDSFPISPVFLLVLGLLFFLGSLVYSFYKKEFLSLAYGFLIWIFSFFLILSQTRGAILALVIGAAVFLIHLVFFLPKTWKKWSFAVLIVLFLTTGSLYYYRHLPFVQNLPGGRVLELFDQGSKADSVQTRLWTWGSAWKGFKERPILGWGQENFSLVFDKHFDPRHYKPGKVSETWFDRAHSVIFDYLAETGILGLLSYLSIFVVLFWKIIKNWHQNFISRDDRGVSQLQSIFLRGLFIILPMTYLIQGLALFDVLPIYINLFFFLALSSHHLDIKNEHHA